MESRRHLVTGDKGPDWHTASQPLGKGNHIRLDAIVFIGKELAASAHAALDFIKNQHRIVLIAQLAHLLHILSIRYMDTALPLNRLQHYSGSLVAHQLFQCLNIIVRHIVKAFRQRSEALMILRLAGSGQGSDGTAVEAVNGRNNLGLVRGNSMGILSCYLDGTLICLRPGVAEENLAQAAELYQLFRSLCLYLGIIQVGAVNHLPCLLCNCLYQLRMIMPQHVYGNASQKVNILFALGIIYINTIPVVQHNLVTGEHRQIIMGILGINLFIS